MKHIFVVLLLTLVCPDPGITAAGSRNSEKQDAKEHFRKLIIEAPVTVIFYPAGHYSGICIESKESAARQLTLLHEDDRLMIIYDGHINLRDKVKIYIPVDTNMMGLVSKAIRRRRQVYRIPEINITINGRCSILVTNTNPAKTCGDGESCGRQTTVCNKEYQQTSFLKYKTQINKS